MLSQAALRAAKQTKEGRDEEIAALRSELEVRYDITSGFSSPIRLFYVIICCLIWFNQSLQEGAAAAVEQFREAESEAKALRTMTQRMILTQEEMVCFIEIEDIDNFAIYIDNYIVFCITF